MVFEKYAVRNAQDEIVEEDQIAGNGTKQAKKLRKLSSSAFIF